MKDGDLRFRLLGPSDDVTLERISFPALSWRRDGDLYIASAKAHGVHRYALELRSPSETRRVEGTLLAARWDLCVFPWTKDPREDLEGWRAEAKGPKARRMELAQLRLPYASGGPSDLYKELDGLPRERFGTIAKTKLELPAGSWSVKTLSDDGVRVVVDGQSVIENWTWHGPTRDEGRFVVDKRKSVEILVEHFEIDGYAVLEFEIEAVETR